MNKTELIEAVASDVGDRKVAEQAVASVLNAVMRTVAAGEKVTLSGFGTWERRTRPARTARNPATGAKIKLKATHVAAFKVGSQFKEIAAAGKMPKTAKTAKVAAAKKATAATVAPVKKARPAKVAATRAVTKATAAKKAVAVKKAPATKAAPVKRVAVKAPATTTRARAK